MGLLGRIFGKDGRRGEEPPSSGLGDDDAHEATTSVAPRNAPRRELVQVVLRDTMRKHGIPSDWIECRVLSVMSVSRGTGMHLLLLVRHGDDRLATYVHAFQASFMEELLKFEPKAADWMFSLSWQFESKPTPGHAEMPEPASWQGAAAAHAPAGMEPATASPEEDELQADLDALFAIRDAALKAPGDAQDADGQRPDFEDTRPADNG